MQCTISIPYKVCTVLKEKQAHIIIKKNLPHLTVGRGMFSFQSHVHMIKHTVNCKFTNLHVFTFVKLGRKKIQLFIPPKSTGMNLVCKLYCGDLGTERHDSFQTPNTQIWRFFHPFFVLLMVRGGKINMVLPPATQTVARRNSQSVLL